MNVAAEFLVRGIVVGVFQENCWIIGSRQSREAICVDPGDQPDDILALARDLGVSIKVIANSHAHVDHVMGVAGVQKATGARFLLHAADFDLAAHGWQRAAHMLGHVADPPPVPDAPIADGDIVEAGGVRLQVLHTPGHTPGSVSFYAAEAGMLFSGDTLFEGSIGRTDMPGGDFRQEMHSILTKLLALPDETRVLPGHMEETTIGRERVTNPFVVQALEQVGRRR